MHVTPVLSSLLLLVTWKTKESGLIKKKTFRFRVGGNCPFIIYNVPLGFGLNQRNMDKCVGNCEEMWRVGGNMSMKQMKCSPPLKGRACLWGTWDSQSPPAPVFISACLLQLFLFRGFLCLHMWSSWNFSMLASFIKSSASPCYLFKIKPLTLFSKSVGLCNCTVLE